MKKKLSTFIYPIIAACICFVVGIVMFSVALALKWGTTCATLQLYAWLILAAVCAAITLFLKFKDESGADDNGGSSPAPEEEIVELSREIKELLGQHIEDAQKAGKTIEEIYDAVHVEISLDMGGKKDENV